MAFALFELIRPSDLPAAAPVRLKLIAPAGYLGTTPLLVRVEALDAQGARERALWDAEVALSSDQPGVILSTNRVFLRNGMGSSLVTVQGASSFNLRAVLGSLQASRSVAPLDSVAVTTVGGSLPAGETVWTGVVRVTNTVVVPAGSTLTILSNTLVLLTGATNNAAAASVLVGGTLRSLGTEEQPVTLTSASASAGVVWGQIRHSNAQPALYRHTIITRAGRVDSEGGHTAQGPVIRPVNSVVVFEHCSITDHADTTRGNATFGTPGKIALANGSDLTFVDCLFQRARMGPEIEGTALLCTNTWILDMRGPDDADGIYLHQQAGGQKVILTGCVLAQGDDDGIDTLGVTADVDNCILREWNNRLEDAKGISVFNGATHVRRSVIVDSTVGIAAKWSGGPATLVTVEESTLHGNLTNVLAQKKSNAPGPFVDYRLTNCVLLGGDAVQSDFAETNFTIRYCLLSEPWPGQGNMQGAPLFVDAAAHDFHLLPGSPAIDAGDPQSPADADASPADLGCFTFLPPPPELRAPAWQSDGAFSCLLTAYTNRNYVIEFAEDTVTWNLLHTMFQRAESTPLIDGEAKNAAHRLYRARLAP